jgi:hypothetical protein
LRTDHISTKGTLLGVWQASDIGGVFDFKQMSRWLLTNRFSRRPIRSHKTMKNIKFVVKVNRGGTRAPEYVLRVDSTPVQMTTNRKLALVMGKFTAEDAVKSLESSRCTPELVSVQVEYGQPSV